MVELKSIVREEVEKYAGDGRGINLLLFPILDDVRQTYTVAAVDYPQRETYASIVVLARVVGDQVIIEEDTTDKKLIDALIQRGIPRTQIVLAYAGESLPEIEQM
jgi:hypothetical protein